MTEPTIDEWIKAFRELCGRCTHSPCTVCQALTLIDELQDAVKLANEKLSYMGICEHNNSVPDPDCGCGT